MSHPSGIIAYMPDTTTTIPPKVGPEQMTLLDASAHPLQFRIDAATRRRGLVHVAELRRVLDAQSRRLGLYSSSTTSGRTRDVAA